MYNKIRDFIMRRRVAYRAVFSGPAADTVLADLKKFCRATSAPVVVSPVSGVVDQQASFIAIGRQEVWHRIASHIHISDSDLYKMVENSNGDNE